MTPDQIKLALQLAIAAIALAAAAAGGWVINGWRMGEKLEAANRELTVYKDQVKVLAAGVQACSKSVEDGARAGQAGVDATHAMLEEAKRLQAQGGQQKVIAKLEQLIAGQEPAGADCNRAWQEIEQAGRP